MEDKEDEEILKLIDQVHRDLTKSLKTLDGIESLREKSQHALFHVGFGVVSPLYHRFRRYLLKSGCENHHNLPTFKRDGRDNVLHRQ